MNFHSWRTFTLLAAALCVIWGRYSHKVFAQEQPIRFVLLQPELIQSRLRNFARGNSTRETNLKNMFTEAGCGAEHLSEQPIRNEKLPNLICTLPGSDDSLIIVGAHFDHAEVGDGVVDNWSGAALLPSLFQSLNSVPRKHTTIFIGFAAEEQGLIGSTFYVRHLAPEQITKIRVMVDFDCLGLGPTNIWLNHSDQKLANILNSVASYIKLPLAVVNADKVGDEDSTSFRKQHVPTVMLHSVTQNTLSILHSRNDNLSAIRTGDYYDSYKLITEYLAYLDARLD